MKTSKKIILSLISLFSVLCTSSAQDWWPWPFNEFHDGEGAQNIILTGEYNYGDDSHIQIGNTPSSPFYGKSYVLLNPGAKLNFTGNWFEINPHTIFKVGSQFSAVYYRDTPVGNESIRPRFGYVNNSGVFSGDTIMKYTGGVGLNSDWGLHICSGSIQFGYFRNWVGKPAWRIYDDFIYVDKDHQFHNLTFGLADKYLMIQDKVSLDREAWFRIGNRFLSELTVDGNMLATGYFKSSDKRLKYNIKPISNSMSIINKLSPKNYLKKTTNNREFGFIAQDVENSLPDLVYKNKDVDGKDIYSIDYQAVLPIIAEAIKELQANIDSNQNVLDKMEHKLNMR